MRAITRFAVAPLFVAAAFLAVGPAQAHAAPAAANNGAIAAPHSSKILFDPICPAGTNWDNTIGACV